MPKLTFVDFFSLTNLIFSTGIITHSNIILIHKYIFLVSRWISLRLMFSYIFFHPQSEQHLVTKQVRVRKRRDLNLAGGNH